MKYANPGGPRKKSKQGGGADTINPPALRKREHFVIKSDPGAREEWTINDLAKPRAPLGVAVEKTHPREQKQISGATGEAGSSVSDSPDVRVGSRGHNLQAVDSGLDVEWQEVSKPVPVSVSD